MKLKLDDKGAVVLQDGKPVYVKEDGSEVAFDAAGTVATISRLNGEAKAHREAKEAAETKLKNFEGIDDPAAAIKALGITKGLDGKTLVDASKVEERIAEAVKATKAQFDPIVSERDTLRNQLHSEVIGGSFARSKYIADALAIPADLVEARFGKHFAVDGGKMVAKDANGNVIYSPSNPGNPASFDESIKFLVDAYPQKDSILKGTGNSGSGAQASNGTGSPQQGNFGGDRNARTSAIKSKFPDLPER